MSTEKRLAFVDALRGFAALWVTFFHIYKYKLVFRAEQPLPEPFHWLFIHGDSGVYVFFAISGFVIALSVRARPVTPSFAGRFMLRRSLRLDIPYWATLALVLATLPLTDAPVPTAGSVAAHAVYLQFFLGYRPLSAVFWTLCLELQFYLLFIAILAIAYRLLRTVDVEKNALFVLAPLFIASAIAPSFQLPLLLAASFLPFWTCFFVGVIACWALEKRVHAAWFFGAIAIIAVRFVLAPSVPLACTILTPLALYALGTRGHLHRTGGRVLQFLGAISYSLYLTHPIAGPLAIALPLDAFDLPLSLGAVAFLIAHFVGASVLFAWLFYVAVERPSHRLSRRIELR